MIENAVNHYRELRAQGKTPSDAMLHARLRFGVDEKVLRDRINGYVADPGATREVLALVRDRFDGSDAHPDEALLRRLYEAITGESLPSSDRGWECPECAHSNKPTAILCHGCGWDSSR